MCGRVIQSSPLIRLAIVDGLDVQGSRFHNYPPRWNGAPSQEMLVIRRNHHTGEVSLDPLRWGLIPYWCEDQKGGRKPINAKCYRPEFEPPWVGRPYVTTLNLNRLGEREIAAMIDRVTGNKALPKNIRQDIIERTDGIPLFVEEMTKAVMEAEGEGAAESAVATVPSPSIGVPPSLHASLMARLDRLGPAKEVAQIGAAIGREPRKPVRRNS